MKIFREGNTRTLMEENDTICINSRIDIIINRLTDAKRIFGADEEQRRQLALAHRSLGKLLEDLESGEMHVQYFQGSIGDFLSNFEDSFIG